jgi:hypothetical protein
MSDRRYDEEEVAQIFERATEAQEVAVRRSHLGEGFTLAELQEIGAGAGIAPELVARAARSLEVEGASKGRRLLGLPIGVAHTVELARPLSEEEWQHLIVDLRETFDARGRLSGEGAFKQWTNGNLEVLLEPMPTGQRLRMRTLKRNAVGMLGSGLVLLVIAAVSAVDMTLSGELAQRLSGLLTLLGVGGGLVGFNAIQLPAWARLRRRQMQEIGERITDALASPPEP